MMIVLRMLFVYLLKWNSTFLHTKNLLIHLHLHSKIVIFLETTTTYTHTCNTYAYVSI